MALGLLNRRRIGLNAVRVESVLDKALHQLPRATTEFQHASKGAGSQNIPEQRVDAADVTPTCFLRSSGHGRPPVHDSSTSVSRSNNSNSPSAVLTSSDRP